MAAPSNQLLTGVLLGIGLGIGLNKVLGGTVSLTGARQLNPDGRPGVELPEPIRAQFQKLHDAGINVWATNLGRGVQYLIRNGAQDIPVVTVSPHGYQVNKPAIDAAFRVNAPLQGA